MPACCRPLMVTLSVAYQAPWNLNPPPSAVTYKLHSSLSQHITCNNCAIRINHMTYWSWMKADFSVFQKSAFGAAFGAKRNFFWKCHGSNSVPKKSKTRSTGHPWPRKISLNRRSKYITKNVVSDWTGISEGSDSPTSRRSDSGFWKKCRVSDLR